MQTAEDGGVGCVLRATTVRYLDQDAAKRLRLCFLCGAAWPKGRRLWCSTECREAWYRNHWWTVARQHAIERASIHDPEPVHYFDDWTLKPGVWYPLIASLCDECAGRGDEVNHVEPRRGEGYGPGCHHHQTNLQVLCHACHVAETTRQRREAA